MLSLYLKKIKIIKIVKFYFYNLLLLYNILKLYLNIFRTFSLNIILVMNL